ncbi:hypothetical protein SAMN04487970_100162 [Paenibacillus tianmuensis]|uniref:Uncharacterized protein n=2 Tax=Paenibacillus tianmuensis TaxID=624147 RepID=A0A1G4P4P1_9BACL|nr:hypothetical protein SAMN04487970_100162 [Paenibacillus tianmuensis]
MKKDELIENLMFFQQFIGKEKVKRQLRDVGEVSSDTFPNFDEVYTTIRSSKPEKQKSDSTLITCEALATGFEEKILTESDIDDLLFRLIEDSLFNSYLYNITSHDVMLEDMGAFPEVMKAWSVPEQKSLIRNVSKAQKGMEYIICTYREYVTDGKLESFRMLLLDKELVMISGKGKDDIYVAYPTLVEFDFKRNLLHIRLRDVDNIDSDAEEVGTMSGRIERTLKFISTLSPVIKVDKFGGFRKSLYQIEENILSEKRTKAEELLATFDESINIFVEQVVKRFQPPLDAKSTPKEFISYAVLSIIATTLKVNELGDVIGIKFRSTRESESNKYAEVSISDKDYKCISTDKVYWQNLIILQEQKAVESLKLIKILDSGFVEAKLEFSMETANVRIHQRSEHPDKKMRSQPSDEKYSDFINYLLPFLIN